MVDRSIKFLDLVNTIYERLSIDRSLYEIQITHKDVSADCITTSPAEICNDSDVIDLMGLYEDKKRCTIHVVLKEIQDKEKEIFLEDDDDEDFNHDNREIEFYEGSSYDDYFSCQIIEQVPLRYVSNAILGPYDNTMNNEAIIGSNPTPEEIMQENVLGIGDDVPEIGGDVFEGNDDNISQEGDDVPQEGDNVLEEGHIIPYQYVEMLDDVREFNSEVSLSNVRYDRSDLMLGQHFVSKDELNNKLSLIAINGKFEIKTKKSTKSLKEVVCVNEDCSWRVRAKKMNGSNFFIIWQYNNVHTCSLMNRSINHKQASSRVIGTRMQGYFKDNKDPPNPRTVMGFMRNEMKVQVSYWKAWKGKQCAQNLIRGTPEEGFLMLPMYCHMLKRVNPGMITHFEVDSENKFKYFFYGFRSSYKRIYIYEKSYWY